MPTHTHFTHSFAHHFLCRSCQNKKEETHAHTAWHYFMKAKTAQTDTLSRSHSSLRLCQANTGRASPLDRLCVTGQTTWEWQSPSKSSLAFPCNFHRHERTLFSTVTLLQINLRQRARSTSSSHDEQWHPLSSSAIATSRVAARRGSASEKARKLLPIGTFVGIVNTFSSTIVKIRARFAPNSNSYIHKRTWSQDYR